MSVTIMVIGGVVATMQKLAAVKPVCNGLPRNQPRVFVKDRWSPWKAELHKIK